MNKHLRTFLVNIGKKNHLFMDMLRFAALSVKKVKYGSYSRSKVDDKLIAFESFMGRKYADSPRAIYEYMLKDERFSDYKFVWFFLEPEEYTFLEENPNTKVVFFGEHEYHDYYSRAKYWFSNSRIMYILEKKPGQKYIQCWHGTPLKKLGFDIEVKGGNAMNTVKDIREKYSSDAARYDYMVSPSAFVTDKYRSAFALDEYNKNVEIIEEGYPRNDFLSNFTDEDITRIRTQLDLPSDKKIILYAPTWRDNQHDSDLGYVYKTEVDFDYLRKELEDEYIILFRAHYFVSNSFDFARYEGFIYDVSDYSDINDLYVVSDVLVTDYSSVFFDYSILKRPMIFYMYDLEEYEHNLRDFYIDLEELPGPIIMQEKELVDEIKKAEDFVIDEKYGRFCDKYTYLEDGNASKRVIERIFFPISPRSCSPCDNRQDP